MELRKISTLMMSMYIITACSFGYTRIQQICLILFIGLAFFHALLKANIRDSYLSNFKVGLFGTGYILLTLWCWIQIFYDWCIDTAASQKMMSTLFLNILFIWAMHLVNSDPDGLEEKMKSLVCAFVLSLTIIIIGCRNSVLVGRLALRNDNGVSFTIGPLSSHISPNGISLWCTIGILICLYLKKKTNEKKYVFFLAYLLLGNILSASRKGIIAVLIGTMIFYIFNSDKKQRSFKICVAGFAIGLIVQVLLVVPILYQHIGYRIEQLINYFVLNTSNESVVGGSMRTRVYLLNMAEYYIKERPWTGYGIDSFRSMIPIHIVVDNNYLEILVSSGVIGFFFYYYPLIIIIVREIKYRLNDTFFYLLISLTAVMIISDFTSSSYYLRSSLLPYILIDDWLVCFIKQRNNLDKQFIENN